MIWIQYQSSNIYVIGVLNKKERGERKKILGKIMATTFPNLLKTIKPQIQEAQEITKSIKTKSYQNIL